MAAVSKPLRQPGLIVYFSGLGTSALVLWLVHYLNASQQFNIMGWYVNGILPAGALGVGVLSGLGYAIASRYLQVKLTRGFIIGMLTTAVLDYIAAQYLTYTQILDQFHLSADRYSFLDYIRQICERMAFKDGTQRQVGQPVGRMGLPFQTVGDGRVRPGRHGTVGHSVQDALLPEMPEISHAASRRPPAIAGFVGKGEAARQEGSPGGVATGFRRLLERVRPIAASLAVAPLAETDSAIAGLEMAASSDAAARVVFTLEEMPHLRFPSRGDRAFHLRGR